MYGPPFRPEIGKVTLSVVPPVMNMKDPAEVCETVVVMFAFLLFPLMSFHEELPGVNVAAEYRANRPLIGRAIGLLVADDTNVGTAVGKQVVGPAVGKELGLEEGKEVGEVVGVVVGVDVGPALGMTLGTKDEVGVIDGSKILGLKVGIHEVGGNVGIPVGPKVGRSVGMDLNNSSSTFMISERDSSLL